ncbi:MAG TPA: DNA mismatch repair protein MutS [Desulfobulbaceae bacterium]|nr:DNA mismatch repair protein MutS [Desulfobulbaceae bacterium]
MNNPDVKMTPMLQQYLEIKGQYQDAILFYRMGDFYEMFFDDAVTASKVLGITLTSRSSKEDEHKVPMCGVPFHAVSGYLARMVKAGFRVAICEQTEDPKQAKGIVKREVIRVVSPGVTTEEQLLDALRNRYVCAMVFQTGTKNQTLAGLSFLDISTGDFLVSEVLLTEKNFNPLIEETSRIQPAEILISERDRNHLAPALDILRILLPGLCVTSRQDGLFAPDTALLTLTDHFRTSSLAGFGCATMTEGIRAAGGLLAYIQETQKTDLSFIKRLKPLDHGGFLIIDESSRRNLELTETIIGGKREGSLLSVLDLTCTPMGARLLRNRLLFPLQDRQAISQRLDSVESLVPDPDRRGQLRQVLAGIADLERLCSRLVLGHGNARDMSALKFSLSRLPELKDLLADLPQGLLRETAGELDLLTDLHGMIDRAISDDAPITLREGNLIREGFNPDLDELIVLLRDGKTMILGLEQKERERTGIAKLKVGYNRVFGYYFELSRSQAADIPADFIRKQTLVNAERFITPELKELENRIASAQEQRLELEYFLFTEIRGHIAAQSERILGTAARVAAIDFLACLAEAAARYQYSKPEITGVDEICIKAGRHPVIERAMDPGRFVPNDILLDQQRHELLIITGPNMAGKSTVLRQTALIVLLAHVGSFVPAEHAEICLVDRIFTRVGAMDDLRRGQSTFMVEMHETANILNNATDRSLVILDEIGRGTSTYDGLAIAWAVTEELASIGGRGVKTLFATHYHELTDLAATNERIQNYSIAVREWNDTIIFLHHLVKGATNRSYGIQVASLAGVPDHVVSRAHEILKNIEQGEFTRSGEPTIGVSARKKKEIRHNPSQLPLFQRKDDPLRDLLRDVRPDRLSPLEALQLLYSVRNLLDSE